MKKTNLLVALSIAILASSSGMIQTQAALYTFSVDFSTKEVANFNNFKQTYSTTTYDLGASITWNWSGSYSFDNCTGLTTLNVGWESSWQYNGTGPNLDYLFVGLPDFTCSTSLQLYQVQRTRIVSDQFVQAVVNDDVNFARIWANIVFFYTAATNGKQLRLHNYETYITLNYNFDTTYLFNYFLSDTQLVNTFRSGSWTLGSDPITQLRYVYTTAGNDEYRIVNTNIGSIGTIRKKYAIDYNQEFFRGTSVGARIARGYDTLPPFTYDQLNMTSSGSGAIVDRYDYYFLNTANEAQAIVNAPVFNFEYEDCGSFLALNVGCFINNGLAYITNDAPIISDAITLLNAGIELAAQTFGIIGNFADDNIFGFLILVGFGFIAVKWLLKND